MNTHHARLTLARLVFVFVVEYMSFVTLAYKSSNVDLSLKICSYTFHADALGACAAILKSVPIGQ